MVFLWFSHGFPMVFHLSAKLGHFSTPETPAAFLQIEVKDSELQEVRENLSGIQDEMDEVNSQLKVSRLLKKNPIEIIEL